MEGSSNVRLVKINFQIPEGQKIAIPATASPTAAVENDPVKIAAAQDKIRALRSQISEQISQLQAAQDPDTRKQGAARLVEMQNSMNTLQRNIGANNLMVGKRIGRVVVAGVSDQVRDDLVSRLPVRVGDILASDSIARINAVVHEFDEHMTVGSTINNATDEAVITIFEGGVSTSSVGVSTLTSPAPGTNRITIGGNVQQAKLVTQPKPTYPPLAKQARIQGVVRLMVIINKDGTVQNMAVINGHPLLIPASLEAVKQWVYQPTLLNGEPVEVQTQIDVNFTLSDQAPPPPGGGQ
jgi:TonB family protein